MEKKHTRLWFDAMVIEDRKIWFFSNEFNALFEMDLDTDEIKYLASVPGVQFALPAMFFGMVKIDEWLVLAPHNVSEITMFNLMTQKFEVVDRNEKQRNFFEIVACGRNAYLIGNNYTGIAKLNIDTKEVTYYNECEGVLSKYEHIHELMPFRKGATIVENSLYIPSAQCNVVVEFLLDREEFNYYDVGQKIRGFSGMCYDGNDFWLAEWKSPILVKWNKETGMTEEYDAQDVIGELYGVGNMFAVGNKIWLFPRTDSDVLNFDINTMNWRKVETFIPYGGKSLEKLNPWGAQSFPITQYCEDTFFTHASNVRKVLEYRTVAGVLVEHLLDINSEPKYIYMMKRMNDKEIISESDECSLELMIETIGQYL